MLQREYYENALNDISESPENKFDIFLSSYKKYFKLLSDNDLCKIFVIREKALRLSKISDWPLKDLIQNYNNNTINLKGDFANMLWCYETVEYTFEDIIKRQSKE